MAASGYRIESLYGIDVDWAAVRSAGDLPFEGSTCAECSLPLQNIIGQFSIDGFQAATFSLHFLAFLAAIALAAFSFWSTPLKQKRTFFGLRIALLLFVISRFFAWVYLAIANSQPVQREYVAFYLIPNFFQYASDVALMWTLTRTAVQPMVVASQYGRAKGVGLGLTIPFGLAALADWILQCVQTAFFLEEELADIVYYGNGGISPANFIGTVTMGFLAILWGIVIFSLSIRAAREARTLAPMYRAVPKMMIAASVIWTLRSLLLVLSEDNLLVRGRESPVYFYYPVPLMNAIFVDIMGMFLFTVLFLCYRPHLSALYSGGAGYAQSTSQTNSGDREGAASDNAALELQAPKRVSVATEDERTAQN